MPTDRMVYWRNVKPSREKLRNLFEDYFGGLAKVEWIHDRYFIVLYSPASFALMRQEVSPGYKARADDEVKERWIEIYIGDDYIDVMTRMQDEATCALAEGLVEICRRFTFGG